MHSLTNRCHSSFGYFQRWSRGHKARGQGQGQGHKKKPRPRTKDTKRKCSPKKKNLLTKIFQAISTKKHFPKNFSSAPQNFNIPKNSAVLEPRTGQFSRTWGLEAKAKDLTFEAKAKAKDFKMCPRGRPRGQGRPRGLHLWLLYFWKFIEFNPPPKTISTDCCS